MAAPTQARGAMEGTGCAPPAVALAHPDALVADEDLRLVAVTGVLTGAVDHAEAGAPLDLVLDEAAWRTLAPALRAALRGRTALCAVKVAGRLLELQCLPAHDGGDRFAVAVPRAPRGEAVAATTAAAGGASGPAWTCGRSA